MHVHYNPVLVALAILIATLASLVALDMAGRTTVSSGASRRAWLAGGSLAMGTGIWSMHFVGMLAFNLNDAAGAPVVAAYDIWLLLSGLAVAVVASALALGVSTRAQLTGRALLGAGVLMGAAIAGMHYTGMAALHVPAVMRYEPVTFAASIVVAIVASVAALALQRRLGDAHTAWERAARRLAAVIMGCAIAGMHFTGMAAARFSPSFAISDGGRPLVPSDALVLGITLCSVLVLAIAGGAAAIDRRHRRELRAKEHESEQRFRSLVERSPEAIVLHADGIVRYANPSACRLVALQDASKAAGAMLLDFVHPASCQLVRDQMRLSLADDEAHTFEAQLQLADGRVVDVELTSVTTRIGHDHAVQTHLRDVTDRKRLERELTRSALHDPLTGLANRALFRDRVEHAVARAVRGGASPVVLYIDLDGFKGVNDGLGHGAGDVLLRACAQRLTSTIRTGDTCSRLGGDEFALLLEGPFENNDVLRDATVVAERVGKVLRVPVRLDGTEVTVGASVGIAVADAAWDAEELIRNADLAMYHAKRSRRGDFVVFESSMQESARERLAAEGELRRAVSRCTDAAGNPPFLLHYQPIVALDSAQIQGFEALVRWQREDGSVVAPLDFIPIAEETGLIVPLGRWILEAACRQGVRWQEEFRTLAPSAPFTISVNLSGRQLQDPGFVGDVGAILARTGFPAESLTLEMTESILVDDLDLMHTRLTALKALGPRLAIDDFGTGYSSLGYLQRFPVDILKIDKSFVDIIDEGDGEAPLAGAVLALGEAMGLHVVAEGIETEGQWARLRQFGCRFGQGFRIGRPVPPDAIAQRLRESIAAR